MGPRINLRLPVWHRHEDRAHTREAVRARALTRREGPVWDAYAHCDRAPLDWERRRG